MPTNSITSCAASGQPRKNGRLSYGEVDKRRHLHMHGEHVTDCTPDMLVHHPGEMESNLVIVEIKSTSSSPALVRKELLKCTAFCDLGYECGILLFFGDCVTAGELRMRCRSAAARANGRVDTSKMVLFWQAAPDKEAVVLDWDATS